MNPINGSSNNHSTTFIDNLVNDQIDNNGFGQSDGPDDGSTPAAAAGGKKGGKAGGAGNAAKITASAGKSDAVVPGQQDIAENAPKGSNAAPQAGGSLTPGSEASANPSTFSQKGEITELAATTDTASTAPVSTDADPKIGAAQTQLANDMSNPSTSSTTLNADVKNLVGAINAAGRGSEATQLVANAIPTNSTAQGSLASVYTMAATNGVDLDNSASKVKDAIATAQANQAAQAAAQKYQQQQAAQQAAQAAQAASQQSGGSGSSGGTSGSGDSNAGASTGASSWNGQKASATSSATSDTSSAGGNKINYSGPASNFPNDTSKWASYDDLWAKSAQEMTPPNTAQQTAWVKEGIDKEAAATGIDPRFILAVVMQESGGNVNVATTNNGVRNPGLMQSFNGVTFDGTEASVLQMIKDGTEGTSGGDGLIQGIQKTGNMFEAARLYNSGQMNASNLSDAQGATASYCSDIANFVMGRS